VGHCRLQKEQEVDASAQNGKSETLAAKFAVMHTAAFVFTSSGDAASPFALAKRKDELGEEPCARSVLFYSVSQ
jgi:hypothetical protein